MTLLHYCVPVRNSMLRVIATKDVYADSCETAIHEAKYEVMKENNLPDESHLNVHYGEVSCLMY